MDKNDRHTFCLMAQNYVVAFLTGDEVARREHRDMALDFLEKRGITGKEGSSLLEKEADRQESAMGKRYDALCLLAVAAYLENGRTWKPCDVQGVIQKAVDAGRLLGIDPDRTRHHLNNLLVLK